MITDETIAAARARWAEMWGDGQIDRAGEQMIDDILEVAAPLIAAQALRRAVERVDERARELREDFRSGAYGIEYINGMEDAVGVVERTTAEFAAPSGGPTGGTPEPSDG